MGVQLLSTLFQFSLCWPVFDLHSSACGPALTSMLVFSACKMGEDLHANIIPSKRKHCTPATLANDWAIQRLSRLKNAGMEMGKNPKIPEAKRPKKGRNLLLSMVQLKDNKRFLKLGIRTGQKKNRTSQNLSVRFYYGIGCSLPACFKINISQQETIQ